jgi:hypothetical protein
MIPWKLAEWVFRRLPLLLIPIVVTPVVVAYFVVSQDKEYRAEATVWVTEAEELRSPTLGDGPGFGETAATQQASVLADLKSTDRFLMDVAAAAGLTTGSELTAEQTARLTRSVNSAVEITSQGESIVRIAATASTPEGAQALVAATLDVYETRIAIEADRISQIAIAYFAEQLVIAQTELETREAAFNAYLVANPAALEGDVQRTDLRFLSLLGSVGAQREIVEGLSLQSQDAHLQAASAQEAQAARFSVQDSPSLPTQPATLSSSIQFGLPLAGRRVGLLIAGTYRYVTFHADHSVRTREDIAALGVPMLGYIPAVNSKQNQRWFKTLGRKERNFSRRLAASMSTAANQRSA